MSEKSVKLDQDEEQKIIAEITKELQAEGYSEEEVRQGLELAYHLKTDVKSKMDSVSDSCEH
ncbi:hypothetical protein [Nitrosopumilus sp. Nsub]|uniref:hypothetical protein n=1 Tax=Nitrosopumilus sp. Nsub TaxID=1776294 RepID=UPI00082C35F0|nr:hypothetical protein [Nitrosopumilus sp. Nsub]